MKRRGCAAVRAGQTQPWVLREAGRWRLRPAPQLRAPRPRNRPIDAQPAPASPYPRGGRRGAPPCHRCPEGSTGSSARAQQRSGPGVTPPHTPPRIRRRGPRATPLGAGRTCLGAQAPASPPQALLTWSWPKARSAAVTPRVQPGCMWVRQVSPCPEPAGAPTQGKAARIALPAGE